ncbi:radical SAM protein [Mesorhizobium sp. M0408]
MTAALFDRLERSTHIITPDNHQEVFSRLRSWTAGDYKGPSLHIVSLTRRCNLNCAYCHMNPVRPHEDRSTFDMTTDTVNSVIDFALSSPNDSLTFEFQGGEPFLNFSTMKYFVTTARERASETGKSIKFAAVSNLMVLTTEHLAYCRANNISVSFSLNGPEEIHNTFRSNWSGGGSYRSLIARLESVRKEFGDVIVGMPLCVVDDSSCQHLRTVIEYFYESGFSGVALIRAKPLGSAARNKIGAGGSNVIPAYIDALDHILQLNRERSAVFVERMVRVALLKILSNQNVGFVDWRNPCGDVLQAITYDIDGEVLPADEARSNRKMFSLGNVRGRTYDELIDDDSVFATVNLSIRDREPECRECTYNPYCGVNPVVEYARTGSARARPYESEDCKFTLALMDWVVTNYLRYPIPLFKMGGFDSYLKDLRPTS